MRFNRYDGLNLKFNVRSVFLVAAPPTFYEGGQPADCATDAEPVERVVCQTAVNSGNPGANSERPDDQRTGSPTGARVGRTLSETVRRTQDWRIAGAVFRPEGAALCQPRPTAWVTVTMS